MTTKRSRKFRCALKRRLHGVVRPPPPGEQEIGDKRDDAAKAAGIEWNGEKRMYAEGVRDALAWVLGELEDDLEV